MCPFYSLPLLKGVLLASNRRRVSVHHRVITNTCDKKLWPLSSVLLVSAESVGVEDKRVCITARTVPSSSNLSLFVSRYCEELDNGFVLLCLRKPVPCMKLFVFRCFSRSVSDGCQV